MARIEGKLICWRVYWRFAPDEECLWVCVRSNPYSRLLRLSLQKSTMLKRKFLFQMLFMMMMKIVTCHYSFAVITTTQLTNWPNDHPRTHLVAWEALHYLGGVVPTHSIAQRRHLSPRARLRTTHAVYDLVRELHELPIVPPQRLVALHVMAQVHYVQKSSS